jgi:acyl-homoserine-lactone acylase
MRRKPQLKLAALAAGGALLAGTLVSTALPAGPAIAGQQAARPAYQATIVRTAYGVPHVTARNFGSLGYGYGFAFAKDNICTMANDYVAVEGQRSRYFGPNGSYQPLTGQVNNLTSDLFWKSVIASRVVPRSLAVRQGPAAIGSALRGLISGYVAGYNGYLASVGGAKGVPDPTCQGKPWVRPITALDEYLRIYQVVDLEGQEAFMNGIDGAKPPTGAHKPASLPPVSQIRALARKFAASRAASSIGSNAIAIGSAGARNHRHGLLLGNPHYPWAGPERFYQVQLTIPGRLNVEGATLFGIPLVVIGFTSTLAWSHTVATAWTETPYQLTLVPGHPTSYEYHGKAQAMTSRQVSVTERLPGGKLAVLKHTFWYSRYGPLISNLAGFSAPWTAKQAFALDDANANNFRFLNHFLATDQAHSVAEELTILKKYEGLPWVNTLAADSTGHALYADIQSIPNVTDAEANRCDTAVGKVLFSEIGLPVLDGSRPSCHLGTNPDSAVPGIFGPSEEPSLQRRDFVENSNDSYWMANPGQPLTGFPRVIGLAGTDQQGAQGADLGLRTRSALTMIGSRIAGTDGLGPAGFTLANLKNLSYSDIQYGARLVKPQVVAMCRAFPGGRAPLADGHAIAVGSSCRVLADWNGREDVDSRGALLFREFWENVLNRRTVPWVQPFNPANPVQTPSKLNVASKVVQDAFGAALQALAKAHVAYDAPLGAYQYEVAGGRRIPLPGGPGDPDGEFNAVYQVERGRVLFGSSYVQAVTWKTGDRCPLASAVVTYSESANPASPHFADQTELFSHQKWAPAYFCPSAVNAHAISKLTVRGR